MAKQPVRGVRRINSGRGHRYTIDGKPAIGVTTALKALDKPALASWSARTVAEYVADNIDGLLDRLYYAGGREPFIQHLRAIPNQKRNSAASKGTSVHSVADLIHKGEFEDVPDDLAPYIDAYLDFLSDFDAKVIHSEFVVAHRGLMYAGTGDSIIEVHHPDLSGTGLFDIKTGKGVYGDFALQAAAYRFAEVMLIDGEERPMVPTDFAAVIHLSEEGYEVVPLRADEQAFEAFGKALWLWRNEMKQDYKTRKSPMDERVLPAIRPVMEPHEVSL